MALNLSTLTSSATSGDVLAEALTTADFLENVPVLRNLSRGSNKGGDAKQDVALNQPKALPLIKNPQGNLGGYLYIPNVSGNYATGPSVTIGANQTWQAEVDMVVTQWGSYIFPFGGGAWNSGFGLIFYGGSSAGYVRGISKGIGSSSQLDTGVTLGTPFNAKYGFNGTDVYVDIDDTRVYTTTPADQSGSITHTLELNQQAGLTNQGNYAIQKAKLTVGSSVVFDCDFNGSTSIRHGDTKFQASVGGPVVLNQSGNDPATVIKKPVLRFSTATSGLKGLFANQIDGGYMFAAFSVLGTGFASGESSGRVFSINKTGGEDFGNGGAMFSAQNGTGLNLRTVSGTTISQHVGLYVDTNGDILHSSKLLNNQQLSKVNNADAQLTTNTTTIEGDEFNIGVNEDGIRFNGENAAIDLQFLALFSADSVPDEATAKRIRDYINGRGAHLIYLRHQTDGYYFYDATKGPVGAIQSGSTAWSGRIVGSDNGDSATLLATQSTSNDAPVGDGFKVTFADNTDHLDIPSTTQDGWQICGTSLGTFVYRINGTTAVTELNLLGNAGAVRSVGNSYGIILLPESATGADIEEARKLLIDRGAADGTTGSSLQSFWQSRNDMVEFKSINTNGITNMSYAWFGNGSLITFPSIDMSNVINIRNAFTFNGSLSSFPEIQAPKCVNFTETWKNCSALTSFPSGAKLGTEASNVIFRSAWQSSGLTSFSTPLPTATTILSAWRSSSITSFSADLPLAIDAREAWLGTPLTSFSTPLPLVTKADYGWFVCSSITNFSAPLPVVESVFQAWLNCTSLTDFSADVFANWNPSSITSGIFNGAWDGCSALSAQSVENILTSIAASNQYATVDGNSGSAAIADAAIDIDYNAASGSLSAATNTAVSALKGRGWSIIVNNVTL